jgi:hypothetical protein
MKDGEAEWACNNEDHIKALSLIVSQQVFSAGQSGGPDYTGPTMLFCPYCGLSLGKLLTRQVDAMQANSVTVTTGTNVTEAGNDE